MDTVWAVLRVRLLGLTLRPQWPDAGPSTDERGPCHDVARQRSVSRGRCEVGPTFRAVAGGTLLAILLAAPVAGQDLPQLPLAPDPARCTVTPRSLDDVRAVWEEVSDAEPSDPEAIDPDIPGAPADEATAAAVTEIMVTSVACTANGHDGLADAALVTDERLRDDLAGLSEDAFSAYYTESPDPAEPEEWFMVYALNDIRTLEDGRVAVNAEFIVPGFGYHPVFVLLEQVDGRWLIDDSLEVMDEAGYRSEGDQVTP